VLLSLTNVKYTALLYIWTGLGYADDLAV